MSSHEHTPLMHQYHELKPRYHDALLFFQVGDFYELFYDDAKKAAAFLGITLTSRGKNKGEPIPLCGVPVHAKDHYVAKLIKGGFNVAICDQLEPPVQGKVVKRGVTHVLTPGTLTESTLLDDKKASYLFSFFPAQDAYGLLFGELLTAQLFATTIPIHAERSIEAELSRFFPDEIIVPETPQGKQFMGKFKQLGYCTTPFVAHEDMQPQVDSWIERQFGHAMAVNIKQQEALQCAVRYFYAYVYRNQREALDQFSQFNVYQPDEFMILDAATQRNLELVKNNQDSTTRHTLFSVLDRAQTPMGSRLLRKWIVRPLVKQKAIEQRQDVVEHFIGNSMLARTLRELLATIGDIERIVGRIALDRAPVHDFLQLKCALEIMPILLSHVQSFRFLPLIQVIEQRCHGFENVRTILAASINDDATKDWIIKQGFDEHLDHLRDLVANSNHKLLEFELREQQTTGIGSLKVRYTQVYGYYIEITHTHAHKVPSHYVRRQTLVGKERFITQELQDLQEEIDSARVTIEGRERELFVQVKRSVAAQIGPLRKLAYALCNLDVLLALANNAEHGNYVRPTFNNERSLIISEGRHPVIESLMHEQFIPNDTVLNDEQCLWIITGPNMGGKSTYLRQVALIAIMAQIGSFIPVRRASMPLLDRIFTRIGAGDNLAEGKSTFLVEMEETATICTEATRNSLVILDEVGRGTSTFDGLAIAQAVVEYIYNRIGARCLFATHYHELTMLGEQYPGIVSYHAASAKNDSGIIFLYKIILGAADGSFGIEVGKLAQLPSEVIARARHVVQTLQLSSHSSTGAGFTAQAALVAENARLKQALALTQDAKAEQLKQRLCSVDYDNLSPKKALDLLWELKELL